MNTKAWLQLGLVLILGGTAGALFFRGGDRARINFHPYRALGTVAAEEVSQALKGQGRIIVVLPDPGSDPDPVLDAQIEAFRTGLKGVGKVEVAGLFPVAMTPFERMGTGGAMPPDRFANLKAKHPDAAGYVFFMGFPMMPESEFAGLKSGPKLMVISAPLPGYEVLLRDGVIQFAIVSKTVAADAGQTQAKTLREVFDQDYVILRPDSGAGK